MANIIDKLGTVIDPARISTDPNRLDELSWDALSEGRLHPLQKPGITPPVCALQPLSTEEVRQVVTLANEEKVPIVPYGGGSGLMGGALSVHRGIVLDLRLMSEVLEVDKESRSVRVQAGAVLEAVEKRVNEYDLILGHDPWTLPVATIGGAISTDSMGYRGGLYGSMGEQVLGLEVVMPTGEVLRTRAVPKSSAGIDLNPLFIGGEGCFGIITEATVRIFPRPEKRVLRAIAFRSFEEGYGAIQQIFSRGVRPALLDFGDAGQKSQAGAVLYLGFEGNGETVDAEIKSALSLCGRQGGLDLPREEAQAFWRDRHDIARRFMRHRRERRERGRDGIYRDWIHVALPGSTVLPFRKAAMEVIERHGISLQESGLWVQPELFSMRLAVEDGGANRAQLALEECILELLRLVHKMGGSMEYTHGVGVKLAPLMAEEHGYGLKLMRRIKAVLDPNGIMNPGKMGL
jgi:alkyldihydroxyacetonephosphate synthase